MPIEAGDAAGRFGGHNAAFGEGDQRADQMQDDLRGQDPFGHCGRAPQGSQGIEEHLRWRSGSLSGAGPGMVGVLVLSGVGVAQGAGPAGEVGQRDLIGERCCGG
ncbi:hypothetical protein ALI22I_24150 [Saccharothrix sp. ALI-22-I]|nr:hypothetical protein ALI22I_24150 [Saccharothrix sp. ALI-22-I]